MTLKKVIPWPEAPRKIHDTENMVSWPNPPNPTHFTSGESMWKHYDYRQFYNPFENLYLITNDNIGELIESKAFDQTNRHDTLTIKARNLLTRIRIEDLFHNDCTEIVFAHLQGNFNTIAKHNPNTPDVYDLWGGPTESEMHKIIMKYIQLLDPYSMEWIHPKHAKRSKKHKNGKYLFKRHPPIPEINPFFLYNNNIGEDEHLRDEIIEDIENTMSSELQTFLSENNHYLTGDS